MNSLKHYPLHKTGCADWSKIFSSMCLADSQRVLAVGRSRPTPEKRRRAHALLSQAFPRDVSNQVERGGGGAGRGRGGLGGCAVSHLNGRSRLQGGGSIKLFISPGAFAKGKSFPPCDAGASGGTGWARAGRVRSCWGCALSRLNGMYVSGRCFSRPGP